MTLNLIYHCQDALHLFLLLPRVSRLDGGGGGEGDLIFSGMQRPQYLSSQTAKIVKYSKLIAYGLKHKSFAADFFSMPTSFYFVRNRISTGTR